MSSSGNESLPQACRPAVTSCCPVDSTCGHRPCLHQGCEATKRGNFHRLSFPIPPQRKNGGISTLTGMRPRRSAGQDGDTAKNCGGVRGAPQHRRLRWFRQACRPPQPRTAAATGPSQASRPPRPSASPAAATHVRRPPTSTRTPHWNQQGQTGCLRASHHAWAAGRGPQDAEPRGAFLIYRAAAWSSNCRLKLYSSRAAGRAYAVLHQLFLRS